MTPPGPSNALGGGRNGPQNWSNGVESDAYFGGGGGSQGGGGDGMGGAKVELELYGERVLLELQELSLTLQMLHILLTLI